MGRLALGVKKASIEILHTLTAFTLESRGGCPPPFRRRCPFCSLPAGLWRCVALTDLGTPRVSTLWGFARFDTIIRWGIPQTYEGVSAIRTRQGSAYRSADAT